MQGERGQQKPTAGAAVLALRARVRCVASCLVRGRKRERRLIEFHVDSQAEEHYGSLCVGRSVDRVRYLADQGQSLAECRDSSRREGGHSECRTRVHAL